MAQEYRPARRSPATARRLHRRVACRAPSQVLQMLRQFFSRAMKRALHRAHRQSRNLGNLVIVELSLVAQRDDLPILRPEPAYCRLQHGRELGPFSKRRWRWAPHVGELAGALTVFRRLLDRLGVERTLSQLVDGHVMRNREKPGRKFTL